MNQLSEYLKRIVVFSLDVSGAFRVLKDLVGRGILDSREIYDLSKKIGVDSSFLSSIIDMLLKYGMLRRKSVHEFEFADKGQVLEAISSLEEFFSDKVVIPEGYKCSIWRQHEEKAIVRVFFFVRDGMRIFRLRKLAVESIVGELAEYLIVPRISLKDLVLAVEVEEDDVAYIRLYWVDPEVLSSPRTFIRQGFPNEKSCIVKASELLSYVFDVEEGDLVEVDLSKMSDTIMNEVKILVDRVFRAKGDVGEHDEICSILAEIGRVKGYEVSLEHKIVGDLRLDAAYIRDGAIAAAFEVVLMGNLKEALFKLSLVNAGVKFLVVGRDKISKAQKVLPQGVRVIEAETVVEAKKSVAALATILNEIGKALNEHGAEVH
ncbi:MAG: hypothetical protein QXE14_03175 [Candidatus Bathyarchaeia archaeon]